MSGYTCEKCNSAKFEMQMRRVIVTVGPSKELQCGGIVPVRACANPNCDALNTATLVEIGQLVEFSPSDNGAAKAPVDPALEAALKQQQVLELKTKLQALEADTGAEGGALDEKGPPPENVQ